MVKASTQYKRGHKADYGREQIEILYEDQYLVVINKPSGMLSVPYPGSKSRTALDVLEQMLRKTGTCSATHRPFTVHRLDRDTSGVMMFALTEPAQQKIMDTWHTIVKERLYRAVAQNPQKNPLPDSGIIAEPLAYNAHNIGFVPHSGDVPSEKTKRTDRNGQEVPIYEKHLGFENNKAEFKTVPARTHYRILARGPTHTLFELSLDTGKKNQIRAHLASKGYPLAGDENYRAETNPFGRLALHARTLEFEHPFTGKHMKFEIAEPAEWLEYVQKGDPHPVQPVWFATGKETESSKPHKKPQEMTKRISGKKLAEMDFITRGKLYHR
jgi:23S rRNA pseudouridine1911/1915/1917 synthase